MDIFSANDFRAFVNENVTDEHIIEEVSTMTNKHLEEMIVPHINKDALSKVIAQAFRNTINEIHTQDAQS